MNKIMEYKRFFAFSEKNNKFFNTTFGSRINIVYGRNTSGKSTLLQAILYTFGINDEKDKLKEILDENVFFRLDLVLHSDHDINISIIRDYDIITIIKENDVIRKFTGISGNNSEEHKLLKDYYADLFGFNLYLEISGEYKQASIEAMFLPYYVAQDVGWVYRLKSFRGLDFIKNFKNDFFDYYLNINNDYDRERRIYLESKKKEYESEISFFKTIETTDTRLEVTKLLDEQFETVSTEYIDKFKENKGKLIELEKDYLIKCNEFSKLEQRKSVLRRVRGVLKNQNPLESNICPTCNQPLPKNIEMIYEYFQDINDTDHQLEEVNKLIEKLKETKGKINSLINNIEKGKSRVKSDYKTLTDYRVDNINYESWLNNKANQKYISNINNEKILKIEALTDITEELKKFKTDDDIKEERNKYDYKFKKIFEKYLEELGVEKFKNDRFLLLYKIPAFPRQGVELLKTLLAYNFAFYKFIESTKGIHRFPFLLDAIFEGDVEDVNRAKILKFINSKKPFDTQIIMSIADSKDNKISASDYNSKYFDNKAKLICIGNNKDKRAFITEYKNDCDDYLANTLLMKD